MSKNLVINGVTYNGIDSMEIPNTEGEKVVFVPEDEAGVELPESMELELEAEIDQFYNRDSGTGDDYARVHAKTTEPVLLGEGAEVNLLLDTDVFGNCGLFSVNVGSTFTSRLGLGLEGLRVPPVIADMLPGMETPAQNGQILEGVETIDAEGNVMVGTMPNNGGVNASLSLGGSYTIPEGYHDGTGVVQGAELPTLSNPATAADIVYGKEVVDAGGNVLTGVVREIASGDYNVHSAPDPSALYHSGSLLYMYAPVSSDVMYRNGSEVGVRTSSANFGDATAEDVAAGKTFTSAAGLKVVGTHECASGGGGTLTRTVHLTHTQYDMGYYQVFKGRNEYGEPHLVSDLSNEGTEISGELTIEMSSGDILLMTGYNSGGDYVCGAYGGCTAIYYDGLGVIVAIDPNSTEDIYVYSEYWG